MFTLVHDVWLSSHLERPSFRLDCDISVWKGEAPLRPEDSRHFVYIKVSSKHLNLVATLIDHGYRLADTNVQLCANARHVAAANSPTCQSATIEFASDDDCTQVSELAAAVFIYDRFHTDPYIAQDIANAIKKSWAGNFFSGKRGDKMVVARSNGQVVGFLQLLSAPAQPLVIDLIAVAPNQQGRGIARAMIAYAALNCASTGQINVGTQLANQPSLRLYQSMGFHLTHSQYVLHAHGPSILEKRQ